MVLKWKRTVYDLKIGIRSMSVAKILSEVNCFRLDKERFIVGKCIFSARLNEMHFPLYNSFESGNNLPLV